MGKKHGNKKWGGDDAAAGPTPTFAGLFEGKVADAKANLKKAQETGLSKIAEHKKALGKELSGLKDKFGEAAKGLKGKIAGLPNAPGPAPAAPAPAAPPAPSGGRRSRTRKSKKSKSRKSKSKKSKRFTRRMRK